MKDYCGAYPQRLGGVILACARDIEAGLEEIQRWGKSRWAWGVMVYAPYGMPLDHPDLEPLWAAAAEHDLCVVLHTFTVMPPVRAGRTGHLGESLPAALRGAPVVRHAQHGGADRQRRDGPLSAAAHRARSRRATAGCRSGWRASTSTRETIKAALPALKMKPSEYVTSGRYFQSIEIPEGGDLTNAVVDLVGDDVLMYASDYPHGESHFPETVEIVMAWDMPEARRRKLMWDNAVRLYARAGLQ